METESDQGLLSLEVRNLGPIKQSCIDVRPLTVFVGPSNTGKSFLAILIYALHKCFGFENRRRPYSSSIRRIFNAQYGSRSKDTLEQLRLSVQQSLSEIDINGFGNTPNRQITLLKPVMEVVRTIFEGEQDAMSKEIERCFGISVNELVRYRSKGEASFKVRVKNNSSERPFEFTFDLRNQTFAAACPETLSLTIPDQDLLNDLKTVMSFPLEQIENEEFDRGYFFWSQISRLFESTMPAFLGTLQFPAYYLPADRTGIMHAHSMVVSSLIERAAMSGLRPGVDTPLLSGVLADFLEQLIVRQRFTFRRRESENGSLTIASDIENLILGGVIQKKRAELTDYPEFVFMPKKWKKTISLINSSSMVSELAPVVLYLREHVLPGDFLIVEEPESHLHPAKQVEFIQLLARLVESQVRVIVITHSEWVIEELGNIVQRSRIPHTFDRTKSEKRVSLPIDDVGVWLFEHRVKSGSSRGSFVKEIKLNDGLYPAQYDQVAQQLHNDWAAISSTAGDIG